MLWLVVVLVGAKGPAVADLDFANFMAEMDPAVYDVEAAHALRFADAKTHEFVAMLEEAQDDSINLEHLASVYLQIPDPIEVVGDIDDGGPEGIGSLAKKPNTVILATIGHPKFGTKQKSLSPELDNVNLVQQQDASVLSPNPPKSVFSSAVTPTFSDSTSNLATLTKSVEDLRFMMDQLKRYLERRLKCRVDPQSCIDATPARVSQPAQECTRRWSYLCRTTFELTPGAGSSAAGGTAELLLLQKGAASLSGEHQSMSRDIPEHVAHDPENIGALNKLIDEQQRQLNDQSLLLEKFMTQLQQRSLETHPTTALRPGNFDMTGVTSAKELFHHADSAPEAPELNSANSASEQQPATVEKNQPLTNQSPESPQSPEQQQPTIDNAVSESQVVTAEPPKSTDEVTQNVSEAVEVPTTVAAGQVEAIAAPQPTGQDSPLQTEPTALQVDSSAKRPPTPFVDEAVQLAEAKRKYISDHRQADERAQIHARANKWATVVNIADHNKGHSRTRLPTSMKLVTNFAQLDEGASPNPLGMPDLDVIDQLAAAAYDEMKQGRVGLQSLVQLTEGENGHPKSVVDDDVVHQLATAAAAKEFGERVCSQRDPETGMCVLYDDGSRCLRTDGQHALCGFVVEVAKNGDLKRQFSVVKIDQLMK